MKRVNRRLFLKTASAAAGAAIFGQGCDVKTPAGESTVEHPAILLPEEFNLLTVGKDYEFPPCCDYTGDYRVKNPPVRPVYGEWGRNFIPVIDLLGNPEKNFPDTSDIFIRPIRNSLGFAIDKLFQGDTHSARNALAVVAYMLIHNAEIELQLQVPKNITKENAAELLEIQYADRKNNRDIWDMVSFTSDVVPKEGADQPSGSAAISKFLSMNNGENGGKYPLLSNWLDRLARIADSMELWTVYRGDMVTTDAEQQNVINKYQELINSCPPELEGQCPDACKDRSISGVLVDHLGQFGFTFDPSANYDEVMASLAIIYLGAKSNLSTSLNNYNSLEADQWLADMSHATRGMMETVVELSAVIDEANRATLEKIEEAKRAREVMSDPDLSIWEIIPCCLKKETWDKLEGSLGDWWGAKKYIVAVGCALVNVPVIIGTAGAGIGAAIFGFFSCFLQGMIGTELEVVGNIVVCIFQACDRDPNQTSS